MEAHMIGEGATKETSTSHRARHGFAHFVPGTRYRAIKAFKNFDRDDHPVGERGRTTPGDAGSANLLLPSVVLSDQQRQTTRDIPRPGPPSIRKRRAGAAADLQTIPRRGVFGVCERARLFMHIA
jgi:hypothetical protein